MSDPAGRLNIRLQQTPDGNRCQIRSTRPLGAARIFHGRTPAETATLLPMLFSICARAQAGACVAALEQALAVPVSRDARLRRARAIAAETVREHLWRILLDWPVHIGAEPQRDALSRVLGLVKNLHGQLDPHGQLFQPGAPASEDGPAQFPDMVIAELQTLAAGQVFGTTPAQWLATVTDADAFRKWLDGPSTIATRLLCSLLDSGEAALGQSPVAALPELADPELLALLEAPSGDDFVARPDWEEQPRESTPLTRHAGAPLLGALARRSGNGLLTRLVAQLHEVALLLQHLAEPSDMPLPATSAAVADGIGIGHAAAARGELIHYVRLTGDRIGEYRILAPTEWNFHPRGPVARALESLPVTDPQRTRHRAALLITAIDPCVAFDLDLEAAP